MRRLIEKSEREIDMFCSGRFGGRALCGVAVVVGLCAMASQGAVVHFSDASGLSAEAEFTLLGGGTQLQVRLRNTSTGVPVGFNAADQLLTGISFDLGAPGLNGGDPTITGGSIVTGASSFSINFSVMNVGANADVGGEWGYGNSDVSGNLFNFISGNAAGTTAFGGPNLDGPANLNGPQAGLVSAAMPVSLGGMGAIQDEVIATLNLSQAIADLSFLDHGVQVEFGSDAAFIFVPTPGAAGVMLAAMGVVGMRRRRSVG